MELKNTWSIHDNSKRRTGFERKNKILKKKHLQNKNQEKLGAKLEEEEQNLSRFHKKLSLGI